MKKQLFALLAACLLLLSLAPAASAITWGQPDGTDHPEVVAILFQRPDGYYSCTGTLLSPTLVITAGHCTEDEEGNPNLATWVRNNPTPTASLRTATATTTSSAPTSPPRWTSCRRT